MESWSDVLHRRVIIWSSLSESGEYSLYSHLMPLAFASGSSAFSRSALFRDFLSDHKLNNSWDLPWFSSVARSFPNSATSSTGSFDSAVGVGAVVVPHPASVNRTASAATPFVSRFIFFPSGPNPLSKPCNQTTTWPHRGGAVLSWRLIWN